jgi:hypothetical protein
MGDYDYDSYNFIEKWCIPDYNSLDDEHKEYYNNLIGSIGLDDVQMVIRDVIDAKYVLLGCVGSCLILIFLYNMMLRCFAEVLCWIAIIGVAVGLFVLAFWIYDYAGTNYPEGDNTKMWL